MRALRDQKGHIYCLPSPPPPPFLYSLFIYCLCSPPNPTFLPLFLQMDVPFKNCSPAKKDLMFPVHLYGLCSQNLAFVPLKI